MCYVIYFLFPSDGLSKCYMGHFCARKRQMSITVFESLGVEEREMGCCNQSLSIAPAENLNRIIQSD